MLRSRPARVSNGPEIITPQRNVAKLLIMALLAACIISLIIGFLPSPVSVTFDGNGADEGRMDDKVMLEGDSVTLPACEFRRDGYLFTHWTTNLGKGVGTKAYLVGDEYVLSGPVTFYANWMKRIPFVGEVATNEKKKFYGVFHDFDKDSNKCILAVLNDSDETLAFDATFTFFVKGDDGKGGSGDQEGAIEKGSYSDQAIAIGPGEFALLIGEDLFNSEIVSYHLTCSEPMRGMKPLGGSVTLEEVSVSQDEAIVELTNTGSEDAQIFSVWCLARAENEDVFAGDSYTTATIEPGKSIQVVFNRSTMFDYRSDYPVIPALDELQLEFSFDGFMGSVK